MTTMRLAALGLALMLSLVMLAPVPVSAHDDEEPEERQRQPERVSAYGIPYAESDPTTWPVGFDEEILAQGTVGCSIGIGGTVTRDRCSGDSHTYEDHLHAGMTSMVISLHETNIDWFGQLCIDFVQPKGIRDVCTTSYAEPVILLEAPNNTTATYSDDAPLIFRLYVSPLIGARVYSHYDVTMTFSYWGGAVEATTADDLPEQEPQQPEDDSVDSVSNRSADGDRPVDPTGPAGYTTTHAFTGRFSCGSAVAGRGADVCRDIDARSESTFEVEADAGLTQIRAHLAPFDEHTGQPIRESLCLFMRGRAASEGCISNGASSGDFVMFDMPSGEVLVASDAVPFRFYVGPAQDRLVTMQVDFELTLEFDHWIGVKNATAGPHNTSADADAANAAPADAREGSASHDAAAGPPWPDAYAETHLLEGRMGCGGSLWVIRTIDRCDGLSKDSHEPVLLREGLTGATFHVRTHGSWFGDSDVCVIPVMPYFDRACGGGEDGTTHVVFEAEAGETGPWTADTEIPVRIKLGDDELVSFGQDYSVEITLHYWGSTSDS